MSGSWVPGRQASGQWMSSRSRCPHRRSPRVASAEALHDADDAQQSMYPAPHESPAARQDAK